MSALKMEAAVCSKCWHLSTELHGAISTVTAMRTSNLK
jgi:hypothetical protein